MGSTPDVILYAGDCTEFLKEIPDEAVQLVVTSPPYNIGKSYEKRIANDIYLETQGVVLAEAVRVLSPTGSLCWQTGNYISEGEVFPLDILLYPICKSLGLKLRNRIIWYFGHGLHCSKRFSGRYETILWFTKGDNYVFNLDPVRVPQKYPGKRNFKGDKKGELSGNPLGKNPSDIWEIPNVKSNHPEKTLHPCQFPIELVERLVLALTNEGDVVLDPYVGVGSSICAAVLHKRGGWGSDTSQEYLEIAQQRVAAALAGTLNRRMMHTPVHEPSLTTKVAMLPPEFAKARGS